jgi:hypothetical protein
MSTEAETIEQAYSGQVAKLFDVLIDNEISPNKLDGEPVALFKHGLRVVREVRDKALQAIKEVTQ